MIKHSNLYMGTFRVGIKSKLKSELKLSNMYAYGKLISYICQHKTLYKKSVNGRNDNKNKVLKAVKGMLISNERYGISWHNV